MRVVGIDKARGGWVAVMLEDGAFAGAVFIERVEQVQTMDASWIAVDMPMAFPSVGRRPAELQARRLLGRRASTVFFTPPRSSIEHGWDEARSAGVSKQMWNLVPSIVEVEACREPTWIEVHPEVVFATLGGSPLPSKRTWDGAMARRAQLEAAGVRLPEDLGSAGTAAVDDVLDATACALVASKHPSATVPLGSTGEEIWTIGPGLAGG